MSALYDTIGVTYDKTRQADPQILQELLGMLQLPPRGLLLDIGCGSGNYTVEFLKHGALCTGLDISKEMLSKARKKSSDVDWIRGNACQLFWADEKFDGAMCILATHHIQELDSAFFEAYRVLKPGARFALFTATSQQMKGYWLWEYFPRIMERGTKEIENLGKQDECLVQAGFTSVETKPFFVTNDLCDWFLHAGKYRPEIYLNPVVRSGISSFARAGYENEVERGLIKLEADIRSGAIKEIIQRYENSYGDYLFIKAKK
jgi:ubiquinone/menaquinone biosynthesis C-methylase UbiE